METYSGKDPCLENHQPVSSAMNTIMPRPVKLSCCPVEAGRSLRRVGSVVDKNIQDCRQSVLAEYATDGLRMRSSDHPMVLGGCRTVATSS